MTETTHTGSHSHGTPPSLSALQLAVIRQLAAGYTPPEIAKVLRVSSKQVREWQADPVFADEVERVVADHDATMRDLLLYGEEQAVMTALAVMRNAVDSKGKPDYKTRLQAALEFLNRKGERGEPVKREETKNLNLSGNVNDALQAALRDPGVRDWLDKEPEVLRSLTDGSEHGASRVAASADPFPVQPESDFELVTDDSA